jgi:hypothetical protein
MMYVSMYVYDICKFKADLYGGHKPRTEGIREDNHGIKENLNGVKKS